MGIRTDPGYELFGDDCGCFDAGKTPKKFWISFGGIKFDTRPPNPLVIYPPGGLLFEQSEVSPCVWLHPFTGNWHGVVNLSDAGGSIVTLGYRGLIAFVGTQPFICANYFENESGWILGFEIGKDGTCQIFWRPDSNSPSIKGVMGKLNIEPHRQTFFEGFPIDATHAVAKYCRLQDATNIKIKFET